MKQQYKKYASTSAFARTCLAILLCCCFNTVVAQDLVTSVHKTKSKTDSTIVKSNNYVKNTFDGNFIIDNQTVMVPVKGTFEFDIQHRFGIVNNGFKDLFGIFSGATMKLGFSYAVINNLQLGFDATNENMQVDWNLKYALLKQTKDGAMPVSVTYYGNMAMDTRKRDTVNLFGSVSDRLSFFSEIIIARKFSDKFSLQISPSLSRYNNPAGYMNLYGNTIPKWDGTHFAIGAAGRYKISDETSLIANYDQPLSEQTGSSPYPNLSFGIEFRTSGHDFEIFFGNYSSLLPQNNHLFNQNDIAKGQFLVGFNISRLWNF